MATVLEMEKISESENKSNGEDGSSNKMLMIQWANYYDKQAEVANAEGKVDEANLAKQWADYYRQQAIVDDPTNGETTKKKDIESMDTLGPDDNKLKVDNVNDNNQISETEDPQQTIVKKKKISPEIEKYWKIVKKDYKDFDSWTYLLQLIENEDCIEDICDGMDAFLEHYPYCYGYWKKYADNVKKHKGNDEVEQIFERGVKAIPLSVDLWIHYLEWTIKLKYKEKNGKFDDEIRNLFDRALLVCGNEFKSDQLWQMALDWESQKCNSKHVLALYDKLISTPTRLYSSHYNALIDIVQGSEPKEILSEKEYLKLRDIVHREHKDAVEKAKSDQPNEDAVIAATLIPPTAADTLGKASDTTYSAHDLLLSEEEENKIIREKVLTLREEIHKQTADEVTKRWKFEDAIKRPYFHIKPLEKSQLKNWREYLEMELKEGSQKKIMVLFERCVIACALYEEFWCKFARYTEECGNIEKTREIFTRVCNTHLPNNVNLTLQWAEYEEKVESTDSALSILESFEKRYPGAIAIKIHKLGILRRTKCFSDCEKILSETLSSVSNSTVKAFWAHKYANFALKIIKDAAKAKEILRDIFKQQPSNCKLALHLIDVLYMDDDAEGLLQILSECMKSESFTLDERLAFSNCRMDYLDDFAEDVKLIAIARQEHIDLESLNVPKRKRKAVVDIDFSTIISQPPPNMMPPANITSGVDGAGVKRNKVDQEWYQEFQQPTADNSSQQFWQQQWDSYYDQNPPTTSS